LPHNDSLILNFPVWELSRSVQIRGDAIAQNSTVLPLVTDRATAPRECSEERTNKALGGSMPSADAERLKDQVLCDP
jgi:hypothetical protein